MADSQHSHISWNDAVLWGLQIKKYIDVTHEGYTAAQRALQQIAVMYLLPSYQPDKTYPEGSIVRVAGKVYKALQETSDNPVTFIGDPAEANNPWQVLIDHDVNDGNWAQLDLDLLMGAASLPEQVEMALGLIKEWDRSINLDYTEWKSTKEQQFQQQLAKQLSDLEDEYAERFQQAEKTIAEQAKTMAEQAKVIAEQRVLIQQQADLLDEFSRSRFILDTYTPKPQDQDLND